MKPPLSSSDRRQLAALAVRLLEAEPRDREAIVARAVARRPDLREEIAGLARQSPDGSVSDPAVESDPITDLADLFEMAVVEEIDDPTDQSGTTIGRYRLIRRLGLGAYGAVYLAERSGRVARPLALKLLHPGVASPRSVRRFIREQRVLAALDHPGVARLIDAGAAPSGCPYFVMELIDGPSLRGYCRSCSPPLLDRVGLVVQVCEAVRHVHDRGIVHRDLKPGNILVRMVEGQPRPIVIDFGVVRLIEHAADAVSTTQGRQMGTRRYMSPEQRAGGAVDARSDVYSLGVTMAEILPEAPADRTGSASARRPRRLDDRKDMLPAALREIVDRCVRERPEERYQAVAELAGELRRFIAEQRGGERGAERGAARASVRSPCNESRTRTGPSP